MRDLVYFISFWSFFWNLGTFPITTLNIFFLMLVVKKVKFSVSDVEHIEVWGFLKNIDYLCHTRQVLEHRSLLPSALDLFQSEIFTRGQY